MRHGVTCILAAVLGWAVVGVARAAPDGGPAPELLPQWTHEFATPVGGATLDAQDRIGVLVAADDRLIALTPGGAIRWITLNCFDCVYSRWSWASLTEDGGAWAVRARDSGTQEVVRIDTHGRRISSVPIASPGRSWGIHADTGQVIVVDETVLGIRRQHFDVATGLLDTWTVDPTDDPYVQVYSIGVSTDGGVTVVFGPSCDISACPPMPPDFSIFRLDADGTLLWELRAYGMVLLEADGGFLVLGFAADGSRSLMHVTPGGEIGPDIPLDGIVGDSIRIAGRYDDHILLYRITPSQRTTFWVLDDAGTVLATRTFDSEIRLRGISAHGVLVRDALDDADVSRLLDPVSLELRAMFRFAADGDTDEYIYFNRTRMVDDSLYAFRLERRSDNDFNLALARFLLPGFAAADRRDRVQTSRALLRHHADPGTPRLHDRPAPHGDRKR